MGAVSHSPPGAPMPQRLRRAHHGRATPQARTLLRLGSSPLLVQPLSRGPIVGLWGTNCLRAHLGAKRDDLEVTAQRDARGRGASYLTIVKVNETGAERTPSAFVAVMISVYRPGRS